jgi:transcriptional regulator with XRE-family HTH domain
MANQRLIRAREAKGLSRRALVAKVNYNLYGESPAAVHSAFNTNYLGKLERGDIKRPEVAAYRVALRSALEVETDEELGFFGNEAIVTALPQYEHRPADLTPPGLAAELDISMPVRETDPVQRRTVLALLARLATGQVFNRADLAQLVAGSSLAESAGSLGFHWQSVASEYGHSYLTSPRRQTMRELAMDLAILELTLPRATEKSTSQALHKAGARLAALLAMACTDLDYGPEARHSWFLARRLSDASENPDTKVWVRGQEALLGIYSGRPLAVLERLTADSLSADADLRGPGAADLLAAQAQTFALQGRTPEALTTLTKLKKTFDGLPEPVVTDVDSVYCWPEHRLRHTESFVYSMVGSMREATRAQDLAIRLYPASRSVSRCQVEMHRSVSLVRDGDVTAGISHATSELEKLSPGRRGKFVLAVAGRVSTAITPAEANRPQARDYRAFLSHLNSQNE